MSDTTDIRGTVAFLCHLAGAEYNGTASILIEPDQLTVTEYQRNEHGRFHLDPETQDAVVTERTLKIKT
jgi:hypothetical protein